MKINTVIKNVIKRKLAMAIIDSQEKIDTCTASKGLRLKVTAFTRQRALGPKRVLHIILQRIYKSLQLCLDNYFENEDLKPVTKQAFSKARANLDPEYVRSFADITSKIAAEDENKVTYKGMPLVAIDGSQLALENTPALKKHFGCCGSSRSVATARSSIAYDPLNDNIYDCRIEPYKTSERTLAEMHMTRLKELNLGGSLLLFDRGYPSAEFIALLYESGFQFLMRVRKGYNLDIDPIKTQGRISLCYNGKKYRVRVMKIVLSTGETEILLTSLNKSQLSIGEAGELYFQRWKIETAYDIIKSRLELENFSGKTVVSVQQDYYATIYLANLVAFAAEEADVLITDADEGKALKHKRKTNKSRTVSKLRERFYRLLTSCDRHTLDNGLDALVVDIARYPIDIRPGRSPVRKTKRFKRFYIARRSVV